MKDKNFIVTFKLNGALYASVLNAIKKMIPPSVKAPVILMTSFFDINNNTIIIALHFNEMGKDSMLKWHFDYFDFKQIFIDNNK